MKNTSREKIENRETKESGIESFKAINPMQITSKKDNISLDNYTQTLPRPKYDEDIYSILQTVKFLNNLAPKIMPEYNFNLSEINGETYYRPDGALLLIREWDSDVVRDYYAAKDGKTVFQILEHDKKTGRLRIKIEPPQREKSNKVSITIFDDKINNKYIIMQISQGGVVNNISEYSGKGKSFQTLFRNPDTMKPVRYIEGKDDPINGFTMIDCLFNNENEIVKIKKYTNKKEIDISYTKESKNITVKTKLS